MLFTAKLMLQKREVMNEVRSLSQKADEINRQNGELEELIKYLKTPEYAEQQAREKLNLKKEGEYVVVLPDSSAEEEAQGNKNHSDDSNIARWIKYFFE
jgi:cell division protein FtsB